MRPRVFPAEDGRHLREPVVCEPASMRPRVFPAEDSYAGLDLADGGAKLQ